MLTRPPNSLRFTAISLIIGSLFLVSIPTALAAKPSRTVITDFAPFTIPAGLGCAFDVGGEPSDGARQKVTVFSDGRTVTHGHAEPTLRNLETGASFVQRSRYKSTAIYDPESNVVFEDVSGRIYIQFFPGDQGPNGVVGEPGALLAVSGHVTLAFDLDTFLFVSFSLDGHATDLCALLD